MRWNGHRIEPGDRSFRCRIAFLCVSASLRPIANSQWPNRCDQARRWCNLMPRLERNMSLRRTLLVLLAAATSAWPQASTGIVSGTVRDQSGAVVPNAPVVLTSIATNISSTTRTNEAGLYFFPGVVVGEHRLSIEFPGMERFEGTFMIQAGQRAVIDPVLKAGQAVTTVEVQDVTPLVNTTNPTVRTTVEHERIEQLPINGRSITNLLSTIPGYEGGRLF